MPGGWGAASADSEGAQAAARFAVSAQAAASGESLTLAEVRRAETQVVAGTNYSLSLRVTRNGRPASATAKVWAKLDGGHELVQWQWE